MTVTAAGFVYVTDSDNNRVQEFGNMPSDASRTLPHTPSTRFVAVFPNPFRGHTRLEYFLENQQAVLLTLHDVRGRVVAKRAHGHQNAGLHGIAWDTRAVGLAAGVYWARLESGGHVRTQKLVLIR